MATIGESLKINSWILSLILFALVTFGVFSTRLLLQQDKKNHALQVKILSLREDKKTPKPFNELMVAGPIVADEQKSMLITQEVNNKASGIEKSPNLSVVNIENVGTQALSIKLSQQIQNEADLDLNTIDNNIAIANELISREPNSYSAYKAKLISILIKEGKFNQVVDENEIYELLENMAEFNINNTIARKEAALIRSNTNAISNAVDQLVMLADQRGELESAREELDFASPELIRLNDELKKIENEEDKFATDLDSLQNSQVVSSLQTTSDDVIEIPFMRLMAKKDFTQVKDDAENFIDQFPQSVSGYFYLIRALEMQGEREEAVNVIQNSLLSNESQQQLLQRLAVEGNQDPINYWQRLEF
jgi:hypothetical protein